MSNGCELTCSCAGVLPESGSGAAGGAAGGAADGLLAAGGGACVLLPHPPHRQVQHYASQQHAQNGNALDY